MRIVLVDNLLAMTKGRQLSFDLQPHLGLLSLIGVAHAAGHVCRLVDPKVLLARQQIEIGPDMYGWVCDEILSSNPDVVGFTTLGCNFVCTARIADEIKRKAGDIPILLGGPHATILSQEILGRYAQFDLVVRGEAEENFPRVLDALPAGPRFLKSIPGLTFRDALDLVTTVDSALVKDLDSLPMPAYEQYPIKALGLDTLRVEAGRGCPFACTFCSTASFFGRSYRIKSGTRLRQEMDELRERFGVGHFDLTHDLFTVNRRKIQEFCVALEGSAHTWSCSARIDCVDRSLLEQMHGSGLRQIYYGIETGSRRLQRLTDKRLDLGLVQPILEITRALEIETTVSFITGFPDETVSDQNETLDYMADCMDAVPAGSVQLHVLTPEPGTALWAASRDTLAYDGESSDFGLPILDDQDKAMILNDPGVFMNYYYYDSPELPRRRALFVTRVFQVLHRLGRPFLRHWSAHHDGTLGTALSALFEWADAHGRLQEPVEDLLLAFAEEAYGREHHLLSLFKYFLKADSLVFDTSSHDVRAGGACRAGDLESLTLRLSSAAAVFHATSDIMDRVAALPAEPGGVRGGSAAFLLLADSQMGSIQNIALSDASAAVLSFFERPRHVRDCMAFSADVMEDVSDLRSYLLACLERRILVPAQRTAEDHGGLAEIVVL